MVNPIPLELVRKISRDAIQLRNLHLCQEIRCTMRVVQKARIFFGHRSLTRGYLKYTHEVVVGGAPDTPNFATYRQYELEYAKWRLSQKDYTYNQPWPKNIRD